MSTFSDGWGTASWWRSAGARQKVGGELEQILEAHGLEAALAWTRETLLPRLMAGDPGPSSMAYVVELLRDMPPPPRREGATA